MPQGKKKIYDPKFLGGIFRTMLLFIFFIEILSFFTHWMRGVVDFSNWVWLLIVSFIFITSIKDLKYGVYAALTELFIGSQGHYFDYSLANFQISIRMGIFAAVMLAWLYHLGDHQKKQATLRSIKSNLSILFLAGITIWGLFFAFIKGIPLKNVFLDFNAWLYFLYFLPFTAVISSKEKLNNLWQIFSASIIAISIKSFVFLFIFSHQMPKLINYLYLWGRDTRWGEFTLIQGNFFRIFSQSQIFVIIGIFIILGYLIFKGRLDYKEKNNQFLSLIILFSLTTIILCLSRSFWLATLITFFLTAFIALFIYRYTFYDTIKSFLRIILLGFLSAALIFAIISFPYPELSSKSNVSNAFADRLNLSGAGISSRWSQLPNLTKEIIKHPIIGSGWGTTVTYQSQDPRILTIDNPNGWYTTFAFEWGYLDIILKIGLIGLIAYLAIIIGIYRQIWQFWKKNKDRFSNALITGLALGLFALLIVHGFTPYLNHPLGIGFILIVISTLQVLYKNQPKLDPTKS